MTTNDYRLILAKLLANYNITYTDVTYYSGYSANYIYQCIANLRNPTRKLLGHLIDGMITSYMHILTYLPLSDLAGIKQQELHTVLAKNNLLPRQLQRMLPHGINAIRCQLYRMSRGNQSVHMYYNYISNIKATLNLDISNLNKVALSLGFKVL